MFFLKSARFIKTKAEIEGKKKIKIKSLQKRFNQWVYKDNDHVGQGAAWRTFLSKETILKTHQNWKKQMNKKKKEKGKKQKKTTTKKQKQTNKQKTKQKNWTWLDRNIDKLEIVQTTWFRSYQH